MVYILILFITFPARNVNILFNEIYYKIVSSGFSSILNLPFYGIVKRFSHISPFAETEIVFIQAVVSGIVSGTKDTYYASQTLP